MPTIGFASISALLWPLEEVAAMAARCGVDGLEVTARDPHLKEIADPESAARAGDQIRAAGLEVITYGSYFSYAGPQSAGEIELEISRARALGAKRIRVWANHVEGVDGDGMKDVADLFRRTADAAGNELQVLVERHDGSYADTAPRCLELLEAIDRPNVFLNYQVPDLIWPAIREGLVDDARRLIPHSRYFHLKNYRPNPDEKGPLLPGGALEGGVLDYRELLGAALQAGYDSPYTIEFLAFDARSTEEKLAADVAYVRGLLEELGAP